MRGSGIDAQCSLRDGVGPRWEPGPSFDHKGKSTAVPATKLSFKVSGGKSKRPGVHSMTARENNTNEILDSPAVTIDLSVEGAKIRIERVES